MLQTEFVVPTTMHSYRAYLLDADGHIVDRIDLTQLAHLAGSFCHFAEVGMSQINGLDGIGS